MLYILVFILILGLLIFVHELGHFVCARKFGVRAEEFGFGFPPRILGWQRNKNGKLEFFWRHKAPLEEKVKDPENDDKNIYINKGGTIYSLNLIPIGGFVKIKGEMGESPDEKDSFANQKAGKRSMILAAGVTMNILLAVVLLTFGLTIGLPQVIDETTPPSAIISQEKISISLVQKSSPAEEAGLKSGDVILNVDGNKFTSIEKIQKYIGSKKDGEVEVAVDRLSVGDKLGVLEDKEERELINQESGALTKKIKVLSLADIFPDEGYDDSAGGGIGIAMMKTGFVSFPWYEALWRGPILTGNWFKEIVLAFYYLFKNLIINHKASMDVAGPVGIAVLAKEVTKLGFVYVLQFTALLSINLALINILPIPALDGGRLLFILIEKIRRKPINQKLESAMHNIVFILLIVLMVLITYRDIVRFIIK
ncbi:MAG: site-2 protease family protein [bacterium]